MNLHPPLCGKALHSDAEALAAVRVIVKGFSMLCLHLIALTAYRCHTQIYMSSLILDPVIILRIYFQLHIGIRASSLVAQLTYDLDVARGNETTNSYLRQ